MWDLDYKESWGPKNWCFWTVVLEKTLKSPLDCKEIQPVHPKGNQSWVFIGNWSWNSSTLATFWEELTHLKRPWCWERLKVGGEGDVRGWDGWMASPTQWTWVWVSSWSWWWTGKPGVLQSMGWTGRSDWTELTYPWFSGPESGIIDCQDFSRWEGASQKYGVRFSSRLSCHLIFVAPQTWCF